MTAQTIIALVAFLLKAATVLAVENGLTGADEATTLPFGTRSSLRGDDLRTASTSNQSQVSSDSQLISFSLFAARGAK